MVCNKIGSKRGKIWTLSIDTQLSRYLGVPKSLDIQIILVLIPVKIAVAQFDFKEQNKEREISNLYEYD